MDTWFATRDIDTKAESDASYARDPDAWGILMSRLADAMISPKDTLREDMIAAAPELGFRRSRNEAMVYRLRGNPPKPQVLVIGAVRDSLAEGQLVSEGQRRNGL